MNTLLGILSSGAKLLGLWGNKTKYGSDESIRRSLIIPILNANTQLLLTVGNIVSLWTQWGSPGDERLRWSHKLCDFLYDYNGDDQVNHAHTVENIDVLDGFIYEGAPDHVRLLVLIGISYTSTDDEPTPVSDLFVYSISYNILQAQSSPEVLGCGRLGSYSNSVEEKLSPHLYRNVRDNRCSAAYVTFAKDSQLYSCHVALDDILYKRYVSVHKLLPYAHCKTDRIMNVDVTPMQDDADSNERRSLLVYYEDGGYHRFPLAKIMSVNNVEMKEIHDDFNHFLSRIMTEKMNKEYILSRLSDEIRGMMTSASHRNPYNEIRQIANALVDQEPAGYSWGKEIHTHAVYELPVNLVKQKRDKHKALCVCFIDLYESSDDWLHDIELKQLVNELCIQQHRLCAVYSMSHHIETNYKAAYHNENFIEMMKSVSVAMDNSVKSGEYLYERLQKKYQNDEEEVVDQLATRGITTTDVFYANVTAIDDGLLAISTLFCDNYARNGTHEQRIKYSYELLMIYCHMLQEANKASEELRSNEVTNRDMDYKNCFVCSHAVRKSVLLLLNLFIGRDNNTKIFTEQALLLRDIVGLFSKRDLQDLCNMCDILLSSYEVQCMDSRQTGRSACHMPTDFRREYEEMKEVTMKMLILLKHLPEAYELSTKYYYYYGIVYCAHTIHDKNAGTCHTPGCGNYAKYNKIIINAQPKYCSDCKPDELMGHVTAGYRRLYHIIAEYKDVLATYETVQGKRIPFYSYCLHYFHQPEEVERDAFLFNAPPCEVLFDLLQLVVPDIDDDNHSDCLKEQKILFLKRTPDIAAKYYIRNSDYEKAVDFCYEAGMSTNDDNNKDVMHSMSKLAAKLHDMKCEPAVVIPSATSLACSQLLSCQKVIHPPNPCVGNYLLIFTI